MSASGGTVAMDLQSNPQNSIDSSRTCDVEASEMTGKNSLLSNSTVTAADTDQEGATSDTIPHPLQNHTPEEEEIPIEPESQEPVKDNGKKGRRVVFGEGEKIVSGYMDPPSPWNDGEFV